MGGRISFSVVAAAHPEEVDTLITAGVAGINTGGERLQTDLFCFLYTALGRWQQLFVHIQMLSV